MAIIQNLYQLVKSLLFVFLANEKQQRSSSSKKRQSVKLITPPLTPDTMTSPISSFQQQEPLGMLIYYHVIKYLKHPFL